MPSNACEEIKVSLSQTLTDSHALSLPAGCLIRNSMNVTFFPDSACDEAAASNAQKTFLSRIRPDKNA